MTAMSAMTDVANVENPYSFTIQSLQDRFYEINESVVATGNYRKSYYNAAKIFKQTFDLSNFGSMHSVPVIMRQEGAILVLNIVYNASNEISCAEFKASGFKFQSSRGLNPSIYLSNEYSSLWGAFDKVYRRSLQIIRPGLYLAFFDCQVTLQGPCKLIIYILNILAIVVQKHYASLLPIVKLREINLDETEIEILSGCVEDESLVTHLSFAKGVAESLSMLSKITGRSVKLSQLISSTPYQLNNDVHILVFGKLTSLGEKFISIDTRLFEQMPLQLFEAIHFGLYDSDVCTAFYRQMRVLKQSLGGKGSVDVGSLNAIHGEIKTLAKAFNASKWTRTILDLLLAKSVPFDLNDKNVEEKPDKKEKIGGFLSLIMKKTKVVAAESPILANIEDGPVFSPNTKSSSNFFASF